MTESMHEYVINRLLHGQQTYAEVARGARMSKRTIEKIARREIKDPGVSHVEKLAAYLRKQERA